MTVNGLRFVVLIFSKEILKFKIIKLCYVKIDKQQGKGMRSEMQWAGGG